jgi:hypothetical protein
MERLWRYVSGASTVNEPMHVKCGGDESRIRSI